MADFIELLLKNAALGAIAVFFAIVAYKKDQLVQKLQKEMREKTEEMLERYHRLFSKLNKLMDSIEKKLDEGNDE